MTNKTTAPAPKAEAPATPVVAEVTSTVEHNFTVEDNSEAYGDASGATVTETERELSTGVTVVSYE